MSPHGLHNWIHSHIGCICLTFLHCAFLNVSSNDHHVDHEDDDHHVDHDAGQLQCCCSVCRWVGAGRRGRYEAPTKTKEDFISFVKDSALKCCTPCGNKTILN